MWPQGQIFKYVVCSPILGSSNLFLIINSDNSKKLILNKFFMVLIVYHYTLYNIIIKLRILNPYLTKQGQHSVQLVFLVFLCCFWRRMSELGKQFAEMHQAESIVLNVGLSGRVRHRLQSHQLLHETHTAGC